MVLPAALLLLLAAAQPQPPPPPPDDVEATVVEELVVQARLPGPAWWKVSDADSAVYVLGLPDALPKGTAWDTSVLKRRLQGADRLITPPTLQASVSIFSLPKLLLDARAASRSRTPLETRLSPELAQRLEAAAVRAGGRADDYRATPPWIAGVRLVQRFRRSAGLDANEPLRTVRAEAARAKVRIEPALAVRAKASTLLQNVRNLPDAAGRTCLEAAVGEVEAGADGPRTGAAAWAAGRVRTALATPRAQDVCIAQLPGAGAEKRDSLADQADALTAALGRPGKTVAALSLRSAVAKGGVLDRLRTKGFKVEAE